MRIVGGSCRLYDSHVRRIELTAVVIEDERQLDGSRHLEIVGDDGDIDAALRLVVDRDGVMQEAELSVEIDGDVAVLGFDVDSDGCLDLGAELSDDERLSLSLRCEEGEALVRQRDDGEIALSLRLYGAEASAGGRE